MGRPNDFIQLVVLDQPGFDQGLANFGKYLGRLVEGNRLNLWRCGSIAAMDLKNPIVNYVSRSEAQGERPGTPQNIRGMEPPSVYIVSGIIGVLRNDGLKLNGLDVFR